MSFQDKVLTCGGVNIFGDPKTDCWILGFDPDPFWSEGPKMNVARDAAAWALDDNFLFVFGGSLGKLNGYTDSVEMYHTATGNWLEGPSMSSREEFCQTFFNPTCMYVQRMPASTDDRHAIVKRN